MSKLCFRLFVVSFLVYFASVVLAQKRPIQVKEFRAEEGKVASVEEPDFTRLRVVTDEGVLAVFDADEEWDGRDEPYSQLAYWHDYDSESLFFFDQLLFTEADVLQSVAAMQRDLGIDPSPILAEKPEFVPLAEITSLGLWRPAVEADVLAVMDGQTLGARAEGEISGVVSPCAPNPNCDPAAAAASGHLAAPVRGTPRQELFASAQSGSNCNCGGPGPAPDPFRNIHAAIDHLIVMESDLLTNHFDPAICPVTELTQEVVTTANGATHAASAPIKLKREGAPRRTGTISVTTTNGSDLVNLQIVTTFDDGITGADPQWTLNQTMRLNGDVLSFSGSIGVVEPGGNSYSLAGGWTYSETGGAIIDPASDPQFQSALANMQDFQVPTVAGGLSPGATLAFIANAATMVLNYLRDILRPYTQPSSCGGPVYWDGTAQSCTAEDVPCHARIDDLALRIHNLTEVSQAFKKCMKGRMSCGGSYHPVIRIRCDDASSCGPCSYSPGAWGCNLGGREMWFCVPNSTPANPTDECDCLNTVFHEASHACGALDQLDDTEPLSSYRIGDWFEDTFRANFTHSCAPGE